MLTKIAIKVESSEPQSPRIDPSCAVKIRRSSLRDRSVSLSLSLKHWYSLARDSPTYALQDCHHSGEPLSAASRTGKAVHSNVRGQPSRLPAIVIARHTGVRCLLFNNATDVESLLAVSSRTIIFQSPSSVVSRSMILKLFPDTCKESSSTIPIRQHATGRHILSIFLAQWRSRNPVRAVRSQDPSSKTVQQTLRGLGTSLGSSERNKSRSTS